MTFSSVVRAGGLTQIADYEPGAVFGPRTLADFEFVWMVHGGADRIVDGRVSHLRPGMLSLARPGSVDAYRWDADRSARHAYVHFDLTDPPSAAEQSEWPETRSLAEHPVLAGLCDYLIVLGTADDAEARTRTDDVLTLLLQIFVSGPFPATGPTLPPVVVAIGEHVREVWGRDGMRILGVDELAVAGGVSTGHLFRVFRQLGSTGPRQAFELLRLSRAAVALQRSNAGLAQIAARCGFSNPYHFSRRFSVAYGMPPGRFRTSERALDPILPVQEAGLLPLLRLVFG